MAYAHTPNESGQWHDLVDHLESVAELAAQFAAPFGAGDLARCLGLWHDLGKFNPEFQAYLRAQVEKTPFTRSPHAIWGAALVYEMIWKRGRIDEVWKEIALPIAGHHSGLSDGGIVASRLEEFLADKRNETLAIAQHLSELSTTPKLHLSLPAPTRRELRLRMVFSALVDADYLDTARHFESSRDQIRGRWPSPAELMELLETDQRMLTNRVVDSPVNQIRQTIYERCVEAAIESQGVYRLTVPTGGGKTRSGLAFALKHAEEHRLHRVVVAIPYTSIIDQTAKAYRDILGSEVVLEHHSQFTPAENEQEDERAVRLRLSTENWDAPVIVTTTVQLFESLFGRNPSRVRKLHNLSRSVIVLDEVQTLPTELLEPTLDVLRTLVEEYNVTLVLSTATQPALEDSHYLKPFQGLHISEIVPDYNQYFQDLKRVNYELWREPISWEALAGQVGVQAQIMVVLNRRRDALALLEALQEQGASDLFHLSSLLCGAHRRKTLDKVNARLHAGQPVRLVSTQVVEAGVDLDFPAVWRAMGPLDRIVQAAGRCNRGGRSTKGQVVIFEPADGGTPKGPYAAGITEARALLDHHGVEGLHDPDVYREYFARLFAGVPTDKRQIQSLRSDLKYPEVAEQYRLITEDTVPVVVDYGEGLRRLADWRRHPSRTTWQRLQPYVVSIHAREARLHADGMLEPVADSADLFRWLGDYDDELIGLAEVLSDPSDLVYIA